MSEEEFTNKMQELLDSKPSIYPPGTLVRPKGIMVYGLMFNTKKTRVVLLESQGSNYLKRVYECIGGLRRNGESTEEAMTRIFLEKTRVLCLTWREFHIQQTEEYTLVFLWATGNARVMRNINTEPFHAQIVPVDTKDLKSKKISWLIPMALDSFHIKSTSTSL